MFEKVRDMLAEQLQIDPSEIKESTRLIEDLGADSANIMVMILELESQFNIEVEDEEMINLKTVQNVVDYINSKIA